MKSTQNLPSRLKELRKKNNYSQEYVAEQLNISRQAISHWENGKAYPDIDNLLLLAELYHITVDDLLDVTGEISNKDDLTGSENTNNNMILENIGLAIIIILAVHIPIVPLVSIFFVTVWMKKSNRNYPVIYVLCLICFIVGCYNTFNFIAYFNEHYGISSIEQTLRKIQFVHLFFCNN